MSEGIISMSQLAKCLGHVKRLRALQVLARGEALMTVEIAERVGVRANTLAPHLRILHKNGLVKRNRAGQYSIPPQFLASAEERVVDFGMCLLRLKPSRTNE